MVNPSPPVTGNPSLLVLKEVLKTSPSLMVPSTMVSERGKTSLVTRKIDSDFYSMPRPQGINKKGASKASVIESNSNKGSGSKEFITSGSSSEFNSSQLSSSKHARKVHKSNT
jgi:hypothetical protein